MPSLTDRAIVWVLAALAVALPSFEAPKNVLLVLLLVLACTIGRRELARTITRPDRLELAVFALLCATVISLVWNWELVKPAKAFRDGVSQTLVFWAAFRFLRDDHDRRLVAWSISLGAVIALAYGAWVAIDKQRFFALPDVGASTRSALYVGVALFVAAGLLVGQAPLRWGRARLCALAAALCLLLGMWLLGSRGGILAVLVALAIAAFAAGGLRLVLASGALVLVTAMAALTLPDSFQQHRAIAKMRQAIVEFDLPTSDRERVAGWRLAANKIAAGRDFLFGVGPSRFKEAVSDPANSHLLHAHNLFLTKFVEEGLLGVCALAAFFAVSALRLYAQASRGRVDWLWLAALGAVVIPIVGGLFNSPFVKAHAVLTMLVLGMWAGGETVKTRHP